MCSMISIESIMYVLFLLLPQDANKVVIEANVKRMEAEKELKLAIEQVGVCPLSDACH